jgi:hypothetical protein
MKRLIVLLLFIICVYFFTKESRPTATSQQSLIAQNVAAEDKPSYVDAESIGIFECDEYLRKFEVCITHKVPEIVRGDMKKTLNETRASWKEAVSKAKDKSDLTEACKIATEAAKESLTVFNCEW